MSEQDIRWLQRLSNYRNCGGNRRLDRYALLYFDLFVALEVKMSELSHGL